MVEDTVGEGATVVTGGRRPADKNKGFFYEPTVFMNWLRIAATGMMTHYWSEEVAQGFVA